MSDFEDRVRVPEGTYRAQEAVLRSGELSWAVLSGKMTSGKDTVAPHLLLPHGAVISSYGTLIRADLDRGMPIIREFALNGLPKSEAVSEVVNVLGLREDFAVSLLNLLAIDFQENTSLTVYSRTDNMRIVLQNLGSDWRTLDDEDYWARAGAIRAMEIIASGQSVIAAGSRFLPDVEIPRLEGGFTVRLDVTRETQLRRLMSRDGLVPSEKTLAALDHPGEKCLDDFDHDIRVNNDDDGQYALPMVIDDLNRRINELLKERAL